MSVISRRIIGGREVVVVDTGPPRIYVVLGRRWTIHTPDSTLPDGIGAPIHHAASGDIDGVVAVAASLVPLGPLEEEALREALS